MEFAFEIETPKSIKGYVQRKAAEQKANAMLPLDGQKPRKKPRLAAHSSQMSSEDDLVFLGSRPSALSLCPTPSSNSTGGRLSQEPKGLSPPAPDPSLEDVPVVLSSSFSSATLASTSIGKRNKGGRPRTKPSLSKVSTKTYKRATVLRSNRPVGLDLHEDFWIELFSNCRPDLLFKLRLLNKGFYEATSKVNVWKNALALEFGETLPDPPQGLSHMNYANLLTSHGCQACKDEHKGRARRTYWAFQRRYCEECLSKKVIFEKDLTIRLRLKGLSSYSGRIQTCIPDAVFDSWGHYQWVGRLEGKPVWASTFNGQRTGYLESNASKVINEFQTYLTESPTKQEIDAWLDARRNVNIVLVSQLQAIEDFCETRRVQRHIQTAETKKDRVKFYTEKTKLLDPPIGTEILKECESYRRAIAISRPPINSERSWNLLRPKILKEAPSVYARIEKQKEFDDFCVYRRQLVSNVDDNLAKRIGNDSPEQRFVLDLAGTVIDEMRGSETNIADVDLIHIILQDVYKAYEASKSKPESQFKKPYRLIMDDAKMIYEEKICPLLDRLDTTRQTIAKELSCVYCRNAAPIRPNHTSPLFFEDVFNHIWRHHGRVSWTHKEAIEIPTVSHKEGKGGPTAWLTVEWPKRLPIRPAHRALAYPPNKNAVGGGWNPEEAPEYERMEPGDIKYPAFPK